MKVCVLGSGSKGNSTFFATNSLNCLIDLGPTSLYITKKLKNIGIEPEDINCIFITHTHVDHINGLKVFLKKYNPKIYLSEKMYNELKEEIEIKNYFILKDNFSIDDLDIKVFKTSHDTEDSVGYVFESGETSLVYVTDTGYINKKYNNILINKNIYIIESNHDVKMLMDGSYPYQLKQRILGDRGHLSNYDCSNYLNSFVGDNTKYIFLAHLSEQNNTPELALKQVSNKLINYNKKIIITKQNEETEMVEI